MDAEGTAAIEALHAALPGHHVDLVQVALVHVSRQEEVGRLAPPPNRSIRRGHGNFSISRAESIPVDGCAASLNRVYSAPNVHFPIASLEAEC